MVSQSLNKFVVMVLKVMIDSKVFFNPSFKLDLDSKSMICWIIKHKGTFDFKSMS